MFAGGNDVRSVAWFNANSRQNTHPVGKKASNGLGLFDMSGNVWEWCRDLYSPNAYGRHAKNNPVILDNASTNRVARGGGYNSFSRLVRCTQRAEYQPGTRNRNIGFRVAMYEKPQ
jgi:formylglycine-generating enzyme required for sulfatase activity